MPEGVLATVVVGLKREAVRRAKAEACRRGKEREKGRDRGVWSMAGTTSERTDAQFIIRSSWSVACGAHLHDGGIGGAQSQGFFTRESVN
jgi:hypothetical protein